MTFMSFNIAGRVIDRQQTPFIIAELSGNHQQSLDNALAMVRAAAEAGAHAIKLQTYTADSMTLDCRHQGFVIEEEDSLWRGQTLHALYQKAATPYAWHEVIFAEAAKLGLLAFSSPFDIHAVDFLESLNVPAYKIASFELTDMPLVRRIAQTQKPVIMSTGMATLEEIQEAVNTLTQHGCTTFALLKCTSAYPAKVEEANLHTLVDLRQQFSCEVGLSDHTLGTDVATASVALGASIIEKHVVLSRDDGGVDAAFSLEPKELAQLVNTSHRVWQSLGQVVYGGSASEQASKQYRRSLYVANDVNAGDPVTEENIRVVRPGFGLAPKHYDAVIGKRFSKSLQKGTPLRWELLL